MNGSLALSNGVLYVGRHEQTAHVRPFDLDGRALGPGFSFRGPAGEPCALSGLAVDCDHHLWVADGASPRVRAFSLFGREVAAFGGSANPFADERGALGSPAGLALEAGDEDACLLVASSGRRRHAVQRFALDGRWLDSLRPEGSPLGRFNGVAGVAARGPMAYVCEARAGRIQVFRDGDFHFLIRVPVVVAGRFEPVAVAPLEDGRLVVATAGTHSSLLLLDSVGRLQRVLAECGDGPGQVREPGDVVLEDGPGQTQGRLAVIDQDGDRVQVFTLQGQCFGELEELPGQAL